MTTGQRYIRPKYCYSGWFYDYQVLLVAGGMDGSGLRLSSTEVLTSSATAWAQASPLPRQLYGMRGLTMGNQVYLTGKMHRIMICDLLPFLGGWDGSNYRDEVLVWLRVEQEWEEAGNLKTGRKFHAVTTIKSNDQAMKYCV